MVSWGKIVRGAVAIAAAAALVSGCNSGNEGDPEPSGASGTSAAPVPGYDPCTQIPQSALDSLQLHSKMPTENNPGQGFEWLGCEWVRSTYYAANIQVTNATVDQVKAQSTAANPVFTVRDVKEFTVAGRRAIASHQAPDHPDQQCTVNVDIQGGSLEFFLEKERGPGQGGGGDLDICDMARDVAEKVVPTLPAGT
ncbi:DUF3558 domain-containing protein [Nocardia wallacei]|uniref:DUF3558 domain-containing protein n=1 Tax=Nocardia wallacei TaxID=480035 RepID=UPI002454768A|nr:DUF3558 domain-containing protein [Nocardia wallacei]